MSKDEILSLFRAEYEATGSDVGAALMAVARNVDASAAAAAKTATMASVYRQARAAKAMAERARDEAERLMKLAREIGGIGLLRSIGLDDAGRAVVEACARHFDVTVQAIARSSNRKAEVSRARAVAMFILRSPRFGLSTTDTAHAVGLDNHTSVLYAERRVAADPELSAAAREIMAEVCGAAAGNAEAAA